MKLWLTWVGLASLAIMLGIGLLRLGIGGTSAEGIAVGRKARMFVTGYTSCDYSIRIVKPCDGITASGRKVAPGTVACGPSYPFGTVFEIVGVGRMTCWDRGGGIQDHMLDVWFPDVPSAIRAGISAKWMDVIIYSGPPPDGPVTTLALAQAAAPVAMVAGRGSLAPAPAAPPQIQGAAPAPAQTAKAAPQPRATAQPAPSAKDLAKIQVIEQSLPQADIIARLDGPARRAVGESSLGNLIADMLRAQYSAHIGLVANRDLRADLPAGPLAATQVSAALASDRRALTQDLRGETIRHAIEHSLSRLEGWEGFLHVSGLRIGYNPDAPVGQRLTRFELANGTPIADRAWYRVALTEGVYFGPGYTPILEEGKGLIAYQRLTELAITWLRQMGQVRPPLDGRLAVWR